MARKTFNPDEIDEKLFRDLVGKVSGSEQPLPARPVSVSPRNPPTVIPPESETSGSSRHRKVALPDYETTFLKSIRIKNRVNVCVSEDTRQRLNEITRVIGHSRLSVSGLIENIICNHFELFRDEISELYRNNTKTEFY